MSRRAGRRNCLAAIISMPVLLRSILSKNAEASGFEPPKALTSKRGMKAYAESIMSTGGSTIRSVRSIAESVASFYSFVSGGNRIPKRRRPDVSRLGIPKFYHKNPKPTPDLPGVKYLDTEVLGPYTAAHAQSFPGPNIQGIKPFGSIVLYSHASVEDPCAIYHGRARVQGEVRICLDQPTAISSIDVWLVGKSECILDLAQTPFLNATANLWNREMGAPTGRSSNSRVVKVPQFKGKLPAGTYVFPFGFPPLPRDAKVYQRDHRLNTDKNCRVMLPCSHEVSETLGWVAWQKYVVGVNIQRDGVMEISDEWSMKFEYFPRARPIPRPESPFPFLASRDDWPFSREEIGGWVLTPFGGRGRFKDEMIEVEGILGVQAPAVYSAGQTVKFGLLLWCTNAEALAALASPESIQVDYLRGDMFGLDVLDPHNSARKNRRLTPVGESGRVWLTSADGPKTSPNQLKRQETTKVMRYGKLSWAQIHKHSDYVPRRMAELYSESTSGALSDGSRSAVSLASTKVDFTTSNADQVRDNWIKKNDFGDPSVYAESSSNTIMPAYSNGDAVEQSVHEGGGSFMAPSESTDLPYSEYDDTLPESSGSVAEERSPSPTPSMEGDEKEDENSIDLDDASNTIRLDGEIKVPLSMPPSYRWKYQGIEYTLNILIMHPDYSHISPFAKGIQAETPLWIVTDPPRDTGDANPLFTPVNPAQIPKTGAAITVPAQAVRMPSVMGEATKETRPTFLGDRTWAFF